MHFKYVNCNVKCIKYEIKKAHANPTAPNPRFKNNFVKTKKIVAQMRLKKKPSHILPLLEIDNPTTFATAEKTAEKPRIITGPGLLKPFPYKLIIIPENIQTITAIIRVTVPFNNRFTFKTFQNFFLSVLIILDSIGRTT